jgi:hypothetical protein
MEVPLAFVQAARRIRTLQMVGGGVFLTLGYIFICMTYAIFQQRL